MGLFHLIQCCLSNNLGYVDAGNVGALGGLEGAAVVAVSVDGVAVDANDGVDFVTIEAAAVVQ